MGFFISECHLFSRDLNLSGSADIYDWTLDAKGCKISCFISFFLHMLHMHIHRYMIGFLSYSDLELWSTFNPFASPGKKKTTFTKTPHLRLIIIVMLSRSTHSFIKKNLSTSLSPNFLLLLFPPPLTKIKAKNPTPTHTPPSTNTFRSFVRTYLVNRSLTLTLKKTTHAQHLQSCTCTCTYGVRSQNLPKPPSAPSTYLAQTSFMPASFATFCWKVRWKFFQTNTSTSTMEVKETEKIRLSEAETGRII